MKKIFSILLILSSFVLLSQNNKEIAFQKVQEAIDLMDNGFIDESIVILEECEKLDPENFIYPYETAYAHVLKKDYETAISILEKTKSYSNINSQVYQMIGNCYSYMENPQKAIEQYEEGMKIFPNAGNLYLERGNIYLDRGFHDEAIINYELGIKADPMFSSNYYRLALLSLNSDNKFSGLIYGEIFMNLERTSSRTIEMSKLLYDTYKNAITLKDNKVEVSFCKNIVIKVNANNIEESLKLPPCSIFEMYFVLNINQETEINLTTLSQARNDFFKNINIIEAVQMPTNVLFEYHKAMKKAQVFDAYNHYIFQIGAESEFNQWSEANQNAFDIFVEWYTTPDNYLTIDQSNLFIGD